MYRLWIVTALICLVCGFITNAADIVVSDVELPNLRWGTQEASFTITNNSNHYKFISVVSEMEFEGTYLNPGRSTRSNYLVFDGETTTITPRITVPGNYGKARIKVKIYDVVDTLDPIFENQKVYEQPFFVSYHAPETAAPYLQERVDMPPRVNQHPDFDSEFSRILLLMVEEGKLPNEIARLLECDVQFVSSKITSLMAKNYIVNLGDVYTTEFPVITVEEAEQLRPIAERMADSLATVVARRMPAYDSLISALEAEGKMPDDTNAFAHGGTILYHKYPMIAGVLMWYDLGSSFITENRPLRIFEHTDLCNAFIRPYMYAVQGGDYFQGRHFYHERSTGPSVSILFGDTLPAITCEKDFALKGRYHRKARWQVDQGYIPEAFMLDTVLARQATAVFSQQVQPLLRPLYMDVLKVAKENRHTGVSLGYRWYFWNLTATLAVDKLIENRVIARRGNGQFKMEAYDLGFKQ